MVTHRTQSKTERSAFVGRERELEELELLLAHRVGLISVVGPPGVGKSALAARAFAAAEARSRGVGATVFASFVACDLSTATTAATAIHELAVALDVALTFEADATESIACAIANRGRALVLLDGADADEVRPIVATLATRAKGCVLVTSRRRFDVEGEACITLKGLSEDGALTLFRATASEDRSLPRAAIVEIADLLDGRPRSIELVAAREGAIAAADVLASLRRTNDAAHDPLATALAWSWKALSDRPHEILSACAAFASSFDETEVAVVVGAPDVRDDLGKLVEARWISRDGSRLRIDRSTREWVLREPSSSKFASAHARFFAKEAERFAATLDASALAAIERRTEDLAAAAVALAGVDDAAVAAITGALRAAHAHRGTLTAFIARVRPLVDRVRDPRAEGSVRVALASALLERGLVVESRAEIERGLDVARAGGDARDVGAALRLIARASGDRDEIERVVGEALALAGDLVAIGLARRELGRALHRLEDRPAAIVASERAIADLDEAGRSDLAAAARDDLAVTLASVDRFEDAAALLERSIVVHRERADRRGLAVALARLARARLEAGHPEAASAPIDESLSIARGLGDRRLEGAGLFGRGLVDQETGAFESAITSLRQAWVVHHELGDPRGEATASGFLGILEWEAGALDDAERDLDAAASGAKAAKSQRDEALFGAYLAALRANRGHDAARAAFDEALAMVASVPEAGPAAIALSLLEGFFEVRDAEHALVRGDEDQSKAYRAIALARLEAVVPPGANGRRAPAPAELRAAARLLDHAIRDVPEHGKLARRPSLGPPRPATSGGRTLTVGPNASWFRATDGLAVDLTRRRSLRLLLQRLAEQRLRAPGAPLSLDELVAAGWPGERVIPEAGASRVYTAVRALRDLGLRDVLVTTGEGYFLDPDAEVTYLMS